MDKGINSEYKHNERTCKMKEPSSCGFMFHKYNYCAETYESKFSEEQFLLTQKAAAHIISAVA